ncbi:MAG: hypothetical protein RBT75_02360 [Anaerolineae bacterium]|nr:hypothetical protein [Anaerolineae bacterium]
MRRQRGSHWCRAAMAMLLPLLMLSLLLPEPVSAHDCLTDPLNAADCMRTPGFRPAIAVIVSLGGTVATILVNALASGAATAPPMVAGAIPGVPLPLPGAIPGLPESPPLPEPVWTQAPPWQEPPEPLPPPPAAETPSPGIQQTVEEAIVAGAQSPWADLVKNLTGPASTIAGSLSEFCTFPDSAEVVDAIRSASRAWRSSPSQETAEAYVRAVGKARDVRLSKAAGGLDTLSKVVDVADAVSAGLGKAQERGYTGVDKALTIGAELGKKGLTWILTKNPMVGLTDAALGGATQMIWGKEGRVDIGTAIDKGADAWDRTTQEWASYTEGEIAADAELQTQDQFLHGLRRIREQVNQGKLSRTEGSARMHRLRDRMFGGNA